MTNEENRILLQQPQLLSFMTTDKSICFFLSGKETNTYENEVQNIITKVIFFNLQSCSEVARCAVVPCGAGRD